MPLGSAAAETRSLLGRLGGFAAVVACCAVRSHARCLDWRTEESLFRAAVAAQPNSARAHYNLGSALLAPAQEGDADAMPAALRRTAAASEFLRTVEIDPNYDQAWNNAGATFEELGDYASALAAYEAVGALRGGTDPYALNAAGRALAALLQSGQADDDGRERAAAMFWRAIELGAAAGECQAHALYNLAQLNSNTPPAEPAEPLGLYLQAVACDPEYRGARDAAGAALHAAKRPTEAVEHFEASLELTRRGKGGDELAATANLGGVMVAAGRAAEAVALLEGAAGASESVRRNLEAARRAAARAGQ